MNKTSIEKLWKNYEQKVLPPNAGPIQRTETKTAFYAGAQSLLTSLLIALEPGEEATENDTEMLEEISTEIKIFFKYMEKNK